MISTASYRQAVLRQVCEAIISFMKVLNNLTILRLFTQVKMIGDLESRSRRIKNRYEKVAPPPRLERGTCGLTVRRSNQLS